MASTGSSLDADIAGTIPDTIPMTTKTLNPKAIFLKLDLRKIRICYQRVSNTNINPKAPPMTEKHNSNKN